MRSEGGILTGSVQDLRKKLKSGDLKVAVIGLGRIGLPTAAVFAEGGVKVVGVDIRKNVVEETNSGKCALVDEPGLPELVRKNVERGRLRATFDSAKAIASSDFVIICVPTPVDQTKSPDYSAVITASQTTGKSLRKGSVVIVESTIGPGIAEEVILPILEEKSGMKAGVDFGLASCPERSDPGNIVANMGSVPRIVGSTDPKCTELVAALYESALGVKVIKASNPKTANAIKLTENLYRDVNIALANEFALLFEEFGIDTLEVIEACATKYNFMPHYPGIGVGGPCVVGDEFVYILDKEGLQVTRIADYVEVLRRRGLVDVEVSNGTSILTPKLDVHTLSFDGTRTVWEKVMWFSVRHHVGKVLKLKLTSNRQIRVTPDHPILVRHGDRFAIKRADSLELNDEIPVSKGYQQAFQDSDTIDLIEELLKSGKIPASKVKVKPLNITIKDHLGEVGKVMRELRIPPRQRHEFYRWNYLTLDRFLEIESQLPALFSRDRLALYTSRGSTCLTPATFLKDADFWRFVGYYLSEGCLYSEQCEGGLREMVKITFGAHEKDLIEDCKAILDKWGLRYSEDIRDGSHSLRVSSRIFSLLLHHLDCGKNSYDKKLPKAIFGSSKENVAALLQGLFRGDGWLENRRDKGGVTAGYATVSPVLFQGVLLLLQRFGIVPVCRQILSKKSKVPALALGVSRYEDLTILSHEVGGNSRLTRSLLEHPKMIKRSPVFRDYGSFATAFVKSLEEQEFNGDVYNMEVNRSHTFVSSFGIVTHNCLPSNSYYLIVEGMKTGNIPQLIRMAREINDRMPDHVVELVSEALNDVGKTVRGSKVAVLGVSYKPGVKDIQLTPVERVVARLTNMGASISLYDPMFKGEKVFGLPVCRSLEEASKAADCILIGTAHKEFETLDLGRLARLASKKAAFVDARNVADPKEAARQGFSYRGVGRKFV
jgi:UDPglucose 6-dehydrogenase